jgi:hypothetical protein
LKAAEGRRQDAVRDTMIPEVREASWRCASPLALLATPVLTLGYKIPCHCQKVWQYIGIVKPIIAKLWKNRKSSPI